MERELSAVDVIYKIDERLAELEKRIQAIDDNIKILNNKITKINKVGNQLAEQKPIVQPTSQADFVQASNEVQIKQPEKLVLGAVKTFGYVINRMKEPISSVVINIFDSTNNLVKSGSTNEDGYWEFRLPSGQFSVQYLHSKFKPINKAITIPSGAKEYEVK